ncbi:MAG: hypothetical protein EP343_06215 [Deltaproteobacteria bacterium]|nr:MAG: hypothetical protein EP343_06215 [Deltaproteobacteria bacterium]
MVRKRLWLLFVVAAVLSLSCQDGSVCETDDQCTSLQRCLSGQCQCRPPLSLCDNACTNTLQSEQHCGRCGNACQSGTRCILGRCICPQEETLCDGACTDTQTHPQHCGQCGRTCPNNTRCVDGTCRSLCPEATPTVCSGGCFQTSSSVLHCGACNQPCKEGTRCLSGTCQCPPGTQSCQGRCMSFASHNQHCGQCNKSCGQGQVCHRGNCITQCPTSTPTVCFGGCINTQEDVLHCGRCGNECPLGTACVKGQCLCPPGLSKCNGTCVDLENDHRHCRVCNRSCSKGQRCSQATCQVSCPAVTPTVCFGGCTDLKSDRLHCGACGTRCLGGKHCIQGACACPQGTMECNGQCIQLNANGLHCGACNKSCPPGEFCAKGACVKVCPKPTPTVCNGGCVALETNTLHCGSCNQSCAPGLSCENKQCTCPKDQTLCNGRCVNLKTNAIHCSACNRRCPQGSRCSQGQCVRSCTDQAPDRCGDLCVNRQTDRRHCGACNKSCPASQVCEKGTCTCPNSTTLCGGACVDTQNDSRHCGACNKACSAGFTCNRGTCERICPQGQVECSSQCVNLQTHPQNCGSCETTCKLFQQCVQGKCQCPPNQTLCGDRCVSNDTDPRHCGACNKACAAEESCVKGACQRCTSAQNTCGKTCCPSPYTCCNDACVQLKTSQTHCGACGVACKAGEFCCQGTCKNILQDTQHCGGCGVTCQQGETCCYGRCTNMQTDAKSCGACGIHCQTGEVCCNGACVDTTLSNQHCGSCGTTCKVNEGCCGGVCVVTQLAQGQVYQGVAQKVAQEVCDKKDNNCDGQVDEGVCSSLRTFPGTEVELSQVKRDSSGNLYIAGTFKEKIVINGTTYPTTPGKPTDRYFFVMKESQAGKVQWVLTALSSDLPIIRDMYIDSQNFLIVAVEFSGTIQVQNQTITTKMRISYTVIKLSPQGQIIWNSPPPTASSNDTVSLHSISVGSNEILIAGICDGTLINFGTSQLQCNSLNQNAFVNKLSSSGLHTDVMSLKSNTSYSMSTLKVALKSPHIYQWGTFSNTLTLGTYKLTTKQSTPSKFIAKLSASSLVQWAQMLNENDSGESNPVFDAQENIYAMVGYLDALILEKQVRTRIPGKSSTSSLALFKIAPNGKSLWHYIFTHTGTLFFPYKLLFDSSNGKLYTVTHLGGTVSFGTSKYSSSMPSLLISSFDLSGKYLDSVHLVGTGEIDFKAANLSQGFLYISGDFDNKFTYNNQTLSSPIGTYKPFLLKIPKF